jgi:protein-disulfide isomerase
MPEPRTKREQRQQRAAALREEQARAERRADRRTRLIIVAAVLASIVAIGVAVQASRSGGEADAAVPAGVTPPAGGLVVGATGDAAAGADPVKVDEWLDFQCPFCKQFHDAVGPTLTEMAAAGTIEVEYHPLSFIGPDSVRAANAFGCAIDAGKGQEYLDVLYANQPAENVGGFANDTLVRLGADAGLTDDSFQSCVQDDTFGGWVTNVARSGNEAGVTSTPTLFVGGQRLEADQLTVEGIQAAVAAAGGAASPAGSASPSPTAG